MTNHRFCYAVNGDIPRGAWKLIPDTPEARAEAETNGARHFSIYSFSADPGVEKDVIRYGDLIVDFDSHEGAYAAVVAAQDFVTVLSHYYGVPYESIDYYLTGGKGCHLVIPAILFGGEEGDPELPHIHRRMLERITNNFTNFGKRFDLIDTQLYSMGKGHILRVANHRRENAHYKVPVSFYEFIGITEQAQIDELTKAPRYTYWLKPTSVRIDGFHKLFLECVASVKDNKLKPAKAAETVDVCCEFLSYCKEKAENLSYTAWFAMITNLVKLGAIGKELVHLYSSSYTKYTPEETNAKIAEAEKLCPYSCEKIKKEIYPCSRNCTVKFPYLFFLQGESSPNDSSVFFHRHDGLYCAKLSGDGTQLKVCSPLEVIAYSCATDGYSWGRIVRVTDPKGAINTIVLPMSEIITSPENTLKKLMDCGLQLASYKISKSLVLEYLATSNPNLYGTVVRKCGWIGTRYVLKDVTFGNTKNELFILENNVAEPILSEQGTLEEWKENIGKYAVGQELIIFSLSFALTGVLLTPCGYEGGGVHFFGPSSCGKTTLLLLSGTIYGGGPKGYIKQWRATDNALESTAAMHNDGFLCLDEIGQATSKVVSEVAYMLVNGQAKARANREGLAKSIATWTLSFMSTGELTLSDCIALDFGKEAMAGQNVRILDIPADAGTDHGVFTSIPEGMTGSSFSQFLVRNAKQYYGTPARAFIEKFAENYDENVEKVKTSVKNFIETHMKDAESGQVMRAAQRFGLISAAGELAIEWGIFPWNPGDADAAAIFAMKKWIEQRGGLGDQELTNAITRLKDFVEKNENRFMNIEDPEVRPVTNLAGYRWYNRETKEQVFGFIMPVFDKEICRTVSRRAVLEELLKHGWIVLTKNGKMKDTKTVHRRNRKVIPVVPARWEPETSDDDDEPFYDTSEYVYG